MEGQPAPGNGNTWQLLFDTLRRFDRAQESLEAAMDENMRTLHDKLDALGTKLVDHQEQDDRRFAQLSRRVDGLQAVTAGLVKAQRSQQETNSQAGQDRRMDRRLLLQILGASVTGGLGVTLITHFWPRG